MAQQSSGEFASADPTKGEEDARVQERGIRAKISLSACSSPEHLQRPAPSHLSKNPPRLQGLSHEAVAASRRCDVISAVEPDEPASKFQQRDNALGCGSSARSKVATASNGAARESTFNFGGTGLGSLQVCARYPSQPELGFCSALIPFPCD